MGERGGAGGDHFAGIAIDTVARHRGEAFHQRLAGQPVGEEGADYRVANGKFSHAGTHRHHFTGAIGHGNARLAGPHMPLTTAKSW